jgi:cytosine/uracil/thiamine/allantoin permease
LTTVKVLEVPEIWVQIYSYAWFIGFGISFAVYAAISLARLK